MILNQLCLISRFRNKPLLLRHLVTAKMQTIEGNFTKIVDGLLGAEGPVFSLDGSFYMVVPEVESNGNAAGQIVKVDLKTGKVCVLPLFNSICRSIYSSFRGWGGRVTIKQIPNVRV